MEKIVNNRKDLLEVLNNITFAPSCVNLDWGWDVSDVCDPLTPTFQLTEEERFKGWLVRTSFVRPDSYTGEMGGGYGRWEFIAKGASESAVVKTCWLLVELIVRHELMEAFRYKVKGEDVRIFNPHHSVYDLSMPHFKGS